MCVIMICDTARPTPKMIEKAWNANSHGGGVAWRKDGLVQWRKGLDYVTIRDLIATLPFPFIAHFRTESVGGIRPDLTHPFPIDESGANFLNGKTGGAVLFHNGTWPKWKETMFEAVTHFGIKIPNGKWSDTRALAFLTAVYGPGFLDLVEEKTVAFRPDGMDIGAGPTNGGGWKIIEGVACSNDHFMWKNDNKCKTTACLTWSGLDADGYCQRCRVERKEAADKARAKRSGGGRTEQTFPRDAVTVPASLADPRTTHLTPTQKAGETLAKNDAKKVIVFVGTGGSSVDVPFAPLAVSEKLYGKKGDGKAHLISKKYLNKIRHHYKITFAKLGKPLPTEYVKLLEQISPEMSGMAQS